MPSAFTNLTTGGTFSYTVDNGLTLTGYSSASDTNYALHIYTTAQYAPSIIEADIYSASLQTAASWELAYTTTAPNTSVTNDTGFVNDYRLDWFNSDFRLIKDVSGLDVVLRFKYTGSTNTGIMSLAFPATGTEIVYLNYADMESATDTSITYADANLDVALVSSSTSSSTFSIYWLRTRAYPPNGVMPSVSFGSVISTAAITLYLNGVSNANTTITYGTESNFTAVMSPSTDYISIYVNGTKVVSLTQGKAVYLKTLSAGIYKVTAATNISGVNNQTYYERISTATHYLSLSSVQYRN